MIIKGKKKGEYTFVYDTTQKAKTVFLAGTFNQWDPTAQRMTKGRTDGTFRTTVQLKPGRYEYKFVVDGDWIIDTNGAETTVNEHGTLNNVVVVE